jgi:arylsulfatase
MLKRATARHCLASLVLATLSAIASHAYAAAGGVLPAPHAAERRDQPIALTEGDAPAPAIATLNAPAGAPNVVVILLDDVGFGAAATFGGLIPTPALDGVARDGLRYNRFHTTGICSPTRASLLTGRNPHAANVGSVMNTATNYEGYRGMLGKNTATVAEILKQNGYRTSAWGKWHLIPDREASPAGPFDRWPTGVGFEKFYGFLGGETDQFEPTLIEGTTPVERPQRPGYHLNADLADQAIAWMGMQKVVDPKRPFFVYFAPGGAHAPLQAPAQWIAKFKGKFDQGWDKTREEIFARQQKLGVIPRNAVLTPRPAALPAWDSLTADQKRVAARLMEIYAAFLADTDDQVGRLVTALKQMGQYDNTLFMYVVGDNGASAEGGLQGSSNYMGDIQGLSGGLATMLSQLDKLGGPSTYAHYPAGWAWAMNTPFQWTKQVASHLGGIRNPMVVSWPARIKNKGGLRQQFSHVNDIAPTILEAAGIPFPSIVNGVPQRPVDGVSLAYTFDHEATPDRHHTQYFEVFANRAIYHDGWIASARRQRLPWDLTGRASNRGFDKDTWELYRLADDFSQARDVAAQHPEKLRELQDLFWVEAAKNNLLPLHIPTEQNVRPPSLTAGRSSFTYYPGTVGIPESIAPNTRNSSHSIVASINVPKGGARGVIATMGGRSAGWSLYVNQAGQPVYTYKLFDIEEISIVGREALPEGAVSVSYEFTRAGNSPVAGGIGRLIVNGKEVGQAKIARTSPIFYTIDETFDIGKDTGSAAGQYTPPYVFNGEIQTVKVDLK